MNVALLTNIIAIIVSMIILWIAGGKVVEYALKVANAFNVTTFFVGFVILAVAADLPEITVAITSALRGVSEISVGDLIGANFCDVALVTGVTALVGGIIDIAAHERKRLLTLLGATTLIMLTAIGLGTLYPWHGYILISIYALSIITIWYQRHSHKQDESIRHLYDLDSCKGDHHTLSTKKRWWLITKLFLCLGVVLSCSSLIVFFIEDFAIQCGIPLATAGATILAAGTSLPELALSLNALKRKEYALALGPTLGTVLEQCTLVLGLLTIFSNKPIDLTPVRGTSVFMFIAFLIVSACLMKEQIRRPVGVVLVSLFFCYMAYHFI